MSQSKSRDQTMDALAGEYLPQGAPDGVIQDLLANDEQMLQYAILKELRALRQERTGGRPIESVLQQQAADETTKEASLYVESSIDVDDTAQQAVEFGFASKAVLLWGWDQDIFVAFQKEGANRKIELSASKTSLSIGGDVPLDASKLWYGKQDSSDPDTTLKVIAQ